jgi:hypothetical protein
VCVPPDNETPCRTLVRAGTPLKNAGSKHCFKPNRLPTIYHPEKIVPQWYSEGKSDDFVVTIKLHPDKQGTFAEIEHTNIPDEDFDDINRWLDP